MFSAPTKPVLCSCHGPHKAGWAHAREGRPGTGGQVCPVLFKAKPSAHPWKEDARCPVWQEMKVFAPCAYPDDG